MVQLISLTVEDLTSIIKNAIEDINKNTTPQQHAIEEDGWLRRKDTAEFLHISLTTLDTYTKKGLLTAHKVGHRVLYRKSEITSALSEKISAVKYRSL